MLTELVSIVGGCGFVSSLSGPVVPLLLLLMSVFLFGDIAVVDVSVDAASNIVYIVLDGYAFTVHSSENESSP